MGTQIFMSEDDVRLYFIQNGGIVKNNDIVTYFRSYLSNPSIREEARALFKTFVNKLANVKVENGEKYLVLKRQFYPTLEGNGSSGNSPLSSGFQGYDPVMPSSSSSSAPYFSQYPYQCPPPYVPVGNFPPLNQPSLVGASNYFPQTSQVPPPSMPHHFSPPIQQLPSHMSKSQPSLYGSHFSLNSNTSNYADPYLQQQMPNTYGMYSPPNKGNTVVTTAHTQGMGATDYPLEYGLPLPPVTQKVSPPRRLSFTSPSSSNFCNNSPSRLPPPYRPPPPAYVGSPPPPQPYIQAGRSPVNFRCPTSTNDYFAQRGTPEVSGRHQYRRSLSASGLSGTPVVAINRNSVIVPTTCSSAEENNIPFFIGNGTPPPPVPPRAKRLSSALDRSPDSTGSSGGGRGFNMEDYNYNKENSNPVIIIEKENGEYQNRNKDDDDDNDSHGSGGGNNGEGVSQNGGSNGSGMGSGESTENENSEVEQKISVKERMQKFNRIASEGELPLVPKQPNGNSKNRRDIVAKHESADYDTASLASYGYGFQAEPKSREWILKAVRLDYPALNKMAQETPSLVKRRDTNYTALHWAAKHGHIELVKLLAGTFHSDVNAKSNGGYTPLHLAAQFSRQDVYDILVKAYNADPNMRDHSGKKPMQYMVRQDPTAVSGETFKKLKEKRRSTELQRDRDRDRDLSFLRIGSLNVRVKKTTEAFGHFLGKSTSASNIERILHKSWGSADNLPDSDTSNSKDKEMMPPPDLPHMRGSSSNKPRKTKSRRSLQIPSSESSSIQETQSDSESDTACGFGSEWNN